MKKALVFCILILIIALGIYFYTENKKVETQSNRDTIVKLTKIAPAADNDNNGSNFVKSAGYYEGELVLQDKYSGKEYTLFACSKTWDWVKLANCYKFNEANFKANVESHIYSMELSGCYVGTLEPISC